MVSPYECTWLNDKYEGTNEMEQRQYPLGVLLELLPKWNNNDLGKAHLTNMHCGYWRYQWFMKDWTLIYHSVRKDLPCILHLYHLEHNYIEICHEILTNLHWKGLNIFGIFVVWLHRFSIMFGTKSNLCNLVCCVRFWGAYDGKKFSPMHGFLFDLV